MNDYYDMLISRWDAQSRIDSIEFYKDVDNHKLVLYHHPNMNRITLYLLNEELSPIAGLTGDITEDGFQIIISVVHPDLRGQGLGQILYNNALEIHKVVISDFDISESAEQLWKKLSTIHTVEKKGQKYIMTF